MLVAQSADLDTCRRLSQPSHRRYRLPAQWPSHFSHRCLVVEDSLRSHASTHQLIDQPVDLPRPLNATIQIGELSIKPQTRNRIARLQFSDAFPRVGHLTLP